MKQQQQQQQRQLTQTACDRTLIQSIHLSRKRPPLVHEKLVAYREEVAYGKNQQNKLKTESMN